MSNVNTIILSGNLGDDPKSVPFGQGQSFTTFRLASSRWDHQNKTKVSDWFNVTIFGKQAETCIKYLYKGSPVLVEGRVKYDKWTDKDGKTRVSYEVIANRVSFLGRHKNIPGGDSRAESYESGPHVHLQGVPF